MSGKPKSCVNDVYNSLNFNLTMPYNDLNCEVQQANFSRYHKDIVIQHHDLIVSLRIKKFNFFLNDPFIKIFFAQKSIRLQLKILV